MQQGDLCLVTGITGYLASWIGKYLLDDGYRVRGTMRSLKEKADAMSRILPGAELVELDLRNEAGWTEAVDGCKWIFHVASPTAAKSETNRTAATVSGVQHLMSAACKSGTVKKIVLTSSEAAVLFGHPATKVRFSEDDWTNPKSPEVGEYYRSKTLAEKLAWDWAQDPSRNPNNVPLSTVNPGFILGPPLIPWRNLSLDVLKNMATGKMPMLPDLIMQIIDVRDCARFHIAVMKDMSTNGRRHLAIGTRAKFIEIAAAMRDGYSHLGFRPSTRIAPRFLIWPMTFFDEDLATIFSKIGKDIVCTSRYPGVYAYKHTAIREIVRDSMEVLIKNGLLRR
jgi:dihydroflavonol-4-reductase